MTIDPFTLLTFILQAVLVITLLRYAKDTKISTETIQARDTISTQPEAEPELKPRKKLSFAEKCDKGYDNLDIIIARNKAIEDGEMH